MRKLITPISKERVEKLQDAVRQELGTRMQHVRSRLLGAFVGGNVGQELQHLHNLEAWDLRTS